MNKNYYEDENVRFEIKDGILLSKYKVETLDLKIAKSVLAKRLVFQEMSYPVLVDFSLVKVTTKEARDFFATPEATKLLNAIAVISDSMIGNMIYNFYILLSRPSIPTKLFKHSDEAVAWLDKYK